MKYALAGSRPGFEIRNSDTVTHCADGYTTVHRNGQCVGVYRTSLLGTVGK